MEDKEMENKKGAKALIKIEKGITLIALVVTIIVLLILARNINFNVNAEKMEF
jgi:hypothetical protein